MAAVDEFKQNADALLDAHVLFDVRSDEPAHAELVKQYAHVVRNADDVKKAIDAERSQFHAPDTVRVSVSKPDNSVRANKSPEMDIHFVNYNRAEPPRGKDGKPSTGGGVKDEKPIACEDVKCDVILPKGADVREVIALSPEEAEGKNLKFEISNGRVKFKTPGFLVYRVVRIVLK